MKKTKYDFEQQIEEILKKASNTLSEDDYTALLDSISMMIADGM